MYCTNPTIRIFPAPEKGGNFAVNVITTGKRFAATLPVVSLLNYCCAPRSKEEILLNLASEMQINSDAAEDQFKKFKESELLISQDQFNSHMRAYPDWYKYYWKHPLDYLLASKNPKFSDRKNPNVKKAIVAEYLDRDVPEFYKTYNDKPFIQFEGHEETEVLSSSLSKTLLARRTCRNFANGMTRTELESILQLSFKEAKEVRELQIKNYKAQPDILVQSLFTPFECYFVTNGLDGLEDGIYHYDIQKHGASLLEKGSLQSKFVTIGLGQGFMGQATVLVFITALFPRYYFRYRHERAYRQLLITCSELANQMIVYAGAHSIRSFQSPAMADDLVCNLLKLENGKEEPLYMLGWGK